MELTETGFMGLAGNELLVMLFAATTMFFVQESKKRGADPMKALAVVSVIAGIAWAFVNEYVPADMLTAGAVFAVTVAAHASFIYNLFKKYYPKALEG